MIYFYKKSLTIDEFQSELTAPESVSNEDLKKIAWDFAWNGGIYLSLVGY